MGGEPTHERWRYLLGARGLLTIDPANIEAVLSTRFEDFGLGLRAPTFHPLLGSGIFTQDGLAWKTSRKLLRPLFSQSLRERDPNFKTIQRCVDSLATSIRRADYPSDGKGFVDLQPRFFRLTFDTTLFLLFGDTTGGADTDTDAAWSRVTGQAATFAEAFTTGQDYLAHRGRLGAFYWLLNAKGFRQACRACHRFIDEAVDHALTTMGEKPAERDSYVLIEALARQTRDRRVLRDQTLNVLLAGRDTTGCCLTWTFRLLSRHQAVLDKLREEIRSVCGIGADEAPPTRAQLNHSLPYLKQVVKEVLRLYPSVPVNSREAVRDTVLPVGGGPDGKSPVLVRAGEGVGYCVYAMHRRKDIYGPDADIFRPERWDEERLQNIGWAYLPFNGGPRICLGQEFALVLVYYTVVRMIQLFPKMTAPAGEPDVPVGEERQSLTLVVSPADGCHVSMYPKEA
ncbi:cytochrome P450 alkane hydroxylase [Sporothrix brasiliensis 5110]|uniref:Cytochrome P450 alkane hydroxylase n=1 Tax=Sporothrix brasiliensis 5110 TaxID=1398154 RepID=A0A0C2IS75_9PEZI|nr:cytochrome P450 alkane hydroxylase [Sporothrix brasiliensis 5110]KIH89700.1 cytochrome P450 alkane hydroxylase [Sporothrix brasiliensis 5110]